MTAPTRSVARKGGLPAFVDHIRKFNRKAVRVVNAPSVDNAGGSVSRQELTEALDELEKTVKALRLVTAQASLIPGQMQGLEVRKLAGKRDDAGASWSLGTTAAMIERGQLVTPLEFQRLMGWATRQAVWKAVGSHCVFYLDYKAERYFPTFYSDPAYDRKQLEAVTQILGELPGGSKLQFLLTRKGSLGGEHAAAGPGRWSRCQGQGYRRGLRGSTDRGLTIVPLQPPRANFSILELHLKEVSVTSLKRVSWHDSGVFMLRAGRRRVVPEGRRRLGGAARGLWAQAGQHAYGWVLPRTQSAAAGNVRGLARETGRQLHGRAYRAWCWWGRPV